MAYIFNNIPQKISLSDSNITFLTVFKTNLESNDLINDVQRDYLKYNSMNKEELWNAHVEEWNLIWHSGIEIDNSTIAQRINTTIYSLYSNLRADWQYGISPCG